MRLKSLKAIILSLFLVLVLAASAGATIQWTNNATSVIANAGGITAGATSLAVTAGHGDRFPAVASPHYFMVTLVDTSGNREIVKVTARTALSNTMTITRAQEGTSARAFAEGSLVELRITKNALDYVSKSADIHYNHYVADASATDQGATTNSLSIKSLVDALGSTQATIDLPHTGSGTTTTYTVGTNLTIPSTISLRVHKGSLISVSSGITLTISGAVQAGPYQIFTGAGTTTVAIYPQEQAWWGSSQQLDVATITASNTGLKIKDTNASHYLVIVPGSDLTANRNFTIVTGDAARTVTLAGNLTTVGNVSITAFGASLANAADAAAVQSLLNLPLVGSVIMWPTETPPTGYLECNGASVSRATYASLFAVIGTMYGAADGTHFNLPDYRGRFLRGWANGSTNDPDRATRTAPTATGATLSAGDHVGTEQADGFKAHVHTGGPVHESTTAAGSATTSYWRIDSNNVVDTGSTGGNETRPINTDIMFCIKY